MNSIIRLVAWAGLTGIVVLFAFLPAMVIADTFNQLGLIGNPGRLAVAMLAWTVFAALLPVILGRFILGDEYRLPNMRRLAAVVTAGAACAALATYAVVVAVEIRYGLFDPDYGGFVQALPFAITVLTASLASWLSTAGGARLFSATGSLVALAGIGLLGLDSVAGARDGISQSGWWIVLAFGAATVVAAFALMLLGRELRSARTGTRPAG